MTSVGVSWIDPFLPPWSDAIVRLTVDPAGMTTFPVASAMSAPTFALTLSPALLFRELIVSRIVALTAVPASSAAGAAAAGAAAGAAAAESLAAGAAAGLAAGFGFGLGFGVGAGGGGVGSGAGAGAAAGASARGFEVSTGASWRLRFRLSALAAVCFGSPPRQAPAASRATAMSIVLLI